MIGSRKLPSLKPVETKRPHLGADNENSATPILNQIKIFSDMLKSKEEAYRKKKEEEIFEMEKLELELIKKLHNTQLLQKSAFEELESVLNMKAN